MSNTWEYAKHVQKVREYGGPKAYEKAIRQSAFNAGYLAGRAEGIREGVLYMLPFVAGCGYLAYEKLPVLWRKIKERIDYTARQEIPLEEHQAKGKNLNMEPVCPICGKNASGIDKVIKTFGFDRADNEEVIQREVCLECSDKSNN